MNREKIIEAYIENINPLRAYAYSVVHNADDADDVVQEVAVRIIKATDAGMEIEHPKAFLYRCTRNLAIDLMRKRRDIPQDDEIMERTVKTEPDIKDADFRMSLDQYISTWTPEMKQAFIRTTLNSSRSTASQRICRLIRQRCARGFIGCETKSQRASSSQC